MYSMARYKQETQMATARRADRISKTGLPLPHNPYLKHQTDIILCTQSCARLRHMQQQKQCTRNVAS
jgi:hypothetical protein